MKLSLDIRTSLTQTLTPQQIQYLKLLQLPLVQLEQQVFQEIEQNPMLEVAHDDDSMHSDEVVEYESPEARDLPEYDSSSEPSESYDYEDSAPRIDDQGDPFEFYKLIWQDDSEFPTKGKSQAELDDNEPFQIKDITTFTNDLLQQLRLQPLEESELILGEQIIGNVDSDGYLRRELFEIVNETNCLIAELNQRTAKELANANSNSKTNFNSGNPALQFALEGGVYHNNNYDDDLDNIEFYEDNNKDSILNLVTNEQAEKVLAFIQHLDPPGIASRSIQECLIAQCKAITKPNAAQKLALEILENAYDAFAMKHYQAILKQFEVTEEYLKEAIEVIKRLNPKPGGGDSEAVTNTVIPDFIIEKEEDTDELIISVNDSRMPVLRLSTAYEKLKKETKYRQFNKDTREWIRSKYEDAKFLIQAIRQRKSTMLKVMTSIANLQREFFFKGTSALKPMIYKDISDDTGLDISTICRIVNGKYVQTQFGTFELKFFFSESLTSEDGEDISTTVIKGIIKDIISEETKDKPYSDDKISAVLKEKGYNVARRTVAKYREQLKIPVARLRKEL